ncbi:cytochrome c4 [Pseudomonas sp. MAFF212428]|uniref:Cytochrome c4 n=1 Tax=Pseudomonas brassicae TaxID=2708063 RepID=A0A6B3NLJ0_9PSED|nr:c-type cytochrome [Pseudomonas brassicae]NER60117.1 cytochrome c4 [Pseudomonas brassicae]NER64075.1 cytochrome c4 [Pseudomonas brassicae]
MIPLDRILLSSLLVFSAQAAKATDGQKVFTQGGENPAAMACMSCHGPDGGGLVAAGFPRLAGLPAAYLSKQLKDFRDGSRKQPIMQPLAKALTDAEISAVAVTLAAMPVPATPDIRRQQMATDPVQSLALYGDWSRGIPGCVQCHGAGGVGVGEHFPPLAHQPAAYLVGQLNAWRDGSRSNDPNQLMVGIAKALTDAEIKALADYFAGGANQGVAQ